MPVQALIGLQWGDEGKGKVVDALASRLDMVVRAQGGANAGHTVKVKDKTRVLHLIPSGMLCPNVQGVIGNGVVVDPKTLLHEIQELEQSGIEIRSRLHISERAHLVLPYHKVVDAALEEVRGGSAIGTTRRGIGPAYMDKAARTGITAALLRDPDRLARRVREEALAKQRLLSAVGADASAIAIEAILEELLPVARSLSARVVDAVACVHDAMQRDDDILIEGAQGALLDLDLGTYPYVTSSNCHLGGLLAGSGVPPRAVQRVIGVAKAYCTRVGQGPFPTEELGPVGAKIREKGVEFGSTTGRPRRCGWLDLIALRFAVRTNGVDEIVLTKADVLSGLGPIQVGSAYRVQGAKVERWPSDTELDGLQPIYESFDGFEAELGALEHFEDLPYPIRRLVSRIEEFTGAVVSLVSTGPERTQALARPGARR